ITSAKRAPGESASQCAATKSRTPAMSSMAPNAKTSIASRPCEASVPRAASNWVMRPAVAESTRPASSHRCSDACQLSLMAASSGMRAERAVRSARRVRVAALDRVVVVDDLPHVLALAQVIPGPKAALESVDDDRLEVVPVEPEMLDGQHDLIRHGRVAHQAI